MINGWHSGIVAALLQFQGPRFSPELWFPPAVLKHTGRWIGVDWLC